MASLPFFTPESVKHALYDYLAALLNRFDLFSAIGPSLPMRAAMASVRKPDQKWSDRSTSAIPQLGLGALYGEGWTFMTHLKGFHGGGHYDSYAFVKFSLHPPPETEEEIERLKVMDAIVATNSSGNQVSAKGVKRY